MEFYTFKVVVYLYLRDAQVDKQEALLSAIDLKHKGAFLYLHFLYLLYASSVIRMMTFCCLFILNETPETSTASL